MQKDANAANYVQIITHFLSMAHIGLPAIRPASEHGRTDR
jgi:hypothetical protein